MSFDNLGLRAALFLPENTTDDDAPVSFETLVSSAGQRVEIGALDLECGARLPEVRVAYRAWGRAQPRAILICHALTGSADADEWWPGLIGPEKAFDPEKDFILCSNVLGGCYGTTGPTQRNPGSGQRYGAELPGISIRDMVRAQALWLDRIGVETLELVTGGSMGGMQALEWAAMYPERVEAMAPVAVSGRHSPWCIGLSEAQRSAIRSDPRFRDGRYQDGDGPVDGLAVARMIALCSYRSWHSFEQRFGRELRNREMFEVESYLQYQGQKLTDRFDANSYIALTRAMDSHDLAMGRAGSVSEVLAKIDCPALVVSISSDVLYPPGEQQELACHLPNATLETIESPHGHDGFLIETEQLGRLFRRFRARGRAPAEPSAEQPPGSSPNSP